MSQKEFKNFEAWLDNYIKSQKEGIYPGHRQVSLSLEWVMINYRKFKNKEKKETK